MRQFIVATRNRGKLGEIREILGGLPIEVISMEEAGIFQEIEEYGTTFEENALIKAREVRRLTGQLVIADDSGLSVDYLNGEPGVFSSRFAGVGASDSDKNNKLLELLKGVPFEKRSAQFVCVIAVILAENSFFTVKGTCDGYINTEPVGDNGFGYDPLFYMPEFGMTTAQMAADQKNTISHRGKALVKMVEELKKSYIFDEIKI